MTNTDCYSYISEIRRHRERWIKKRSVREAYKYFYGMIIENLSSLRPNVELGCGCGNLKETVHDIVATDVLLTPWCDQVADAYNLPFKGASVGNVIMVDVLHHTIDPLSILKEISRVLKPGGRAVILEPYITVWSRFVYRYFHHEDYSFEVKFFDSGCSENRQRLEYSNMATSNILFFDKLQQTEQHLGYALKVIKCHPFSFLAYPLTGGFRKYSFIPSSIVKSLSMIEDKLPERIRERFTAIRVLVVLEKR